VGAAVVSVGAAVVSVGAAVVSGVSASPQATAKTDTRSRTIARVNSDDLSGFTEHLRVVGYEHKNTFSLLTC